MRKGKHRSHQPSNKQPSSAPERGGRDAGGAGGARSQQHSARVGEPRHLTLSLTFNGVVAVFSVVVAFATWWQGCVANRNLELLKTEQRAWFLPVQGTEIRLEPGQPFVTPMRWRNSGKTPAFDVKMLCGVGVLGTSEAFLPDYGTKETESSGSRSMVGPGQEVPQPCSSNGLTAEQIAALTSGSSRLYVYGKANYRDVFGEERHTTFCTWWDIARAGLNACPTYNNAD